MKIVKTETNSTFPTSIETESLTKQIENFLKTAKVYENTSGELLISIDLKRFLWAEPIEETDQYKKFISVYVSRDAKSDVIKWCYYRIVKISYCLCKQNAILENEISFDEAKEVWSLFALKGFNIRSIKKEGDIITFERYNPNCGGWGENPSMPATPVFSGTIEEIRKAAETQKSVAKPEFFNDVMINNSIL